MTRLKRSGACFRPLYIDSSAQVGAYCFYDSKTQKELFEHKCGYIDALIKESHQGRAGQYIDSKGDILALHGLDIRKARSVETNLKKGGCFYVMYTSDNALRERLARLYIDVNDLTSFKLLGEKVACETSSETCYGEYAQIEHEISYYKTSLNEETKKLEYTETKSTKVFTFMSAYYTRIDPKPLRINAEKIASILNDAGIEASRFHTEKLIKSEKLKADLIKALKNS